MDDWYLWALAIAALGVLALAWNVPRAAMWIGLGALSFCSSGWWHDARLPYPEVFGAATDLAVICALYAYARLLYELIFWGCFIVMIFIDILSLTHLLNSHHDFAIGLEVANWLALVSIGAAGLANRAGIGRSWVAVFRARPEWPGAIYGRLVVAAAHLVRPT